MRKFQGLWIGVPVILIILALSGCGNSCKRLNCENGSYCHEGECLCAKWYSGSQCQLFYNRNYTGDYVGEYTFPGEQSRPIPDKVSLEADKNIPNRMQLSTGIYFEFVSDTALAIPLQSVIDHDTIIISGKGSYGLDFVEFQYNIQPGSGSSASTVGPLTVQFRGTRVVEVL